MKKLLCVMLSVVLVVSCVPGSWADYYDEGNDGFSEANAYVLDSVGDLVTLRDRVNNGEEPENAYYKLNFANKTVNLAEYTSWEPIGTGNSFMGHFDGNGHTIIMNITNRGGDTASLFGDIATAEGYAVKNLTVDASGSYSINGRYAAGIAQTLSNATIENCTFSGTLSGYYRSPYLNADGLWVAAGGIVRLLNSGTIRNCSIIRASIEGYTSHGTWEGYADGTAYAGGIAARMYGGTIENCTIQNDSDVNASSIFTGSSSSVVTRPAYCGGIVGYGGTLDVSEGIKNCNVSGIVYSTEYAGGIIARLDNGTLENNTVTDASVGSVGISGGIGGYLQGTLLSNNHANAARITANTDAAGGIAGYLTAGAIAESNDVSVGSNVTSNGSDSGGIVGVLEAATIRNNTSYAAISGSASHKGGVVGKIDSANFTIENNKYSGAQYGIGYDASGSQSDNPGCIHIGSAISITTSSPLPAANAGQSYSQTFTADSEETLTWSHVSGDLPSGLTLNASSGTLSGTPTTAGTFTFTVSAADQYSSASKIFTLTVNLVITTDAVLPSAAVNSSYTQTLRAAGASSLTWTVTTGTLPAGLTLNADGTITGTPTTTGTSDFTVQASAGDNITAAKALRITVEAAQAINITTTSLPDGRVGASYTATLAASVSGITWSVSSGSLPAGLTLNASTGTISGTPTTAGTSTFTVRAANSSGSGTKQFSITVAQADSTTITITTSTLPSGTVGTAYSAQLASSVSNTSWSVSSGNLPGGLTLNSSGVISGTPTTSGAFNFTVRAVSGNASATKTLSITVNAASLSITTTSMPSGTVGNAYRYTLQANSSVTSWSVSSGTLPSGLSLDSTTGIISGTLSRSGSYTFTIQARNANGSATRTLTITVSNADGTTESVGRSSGGGGCSSGLGIWGAILSAVVCILRRK